MTEEQEQWLPVVDFPGYEVSSIGSVRRLPYVSANGKRKSLRILKSRRWKSGGKRENPYFTVIVYLRKGDPLKVCPVARLMLEAFVGQPPVDKPLACHLDDDVSHNRLSNLAWGSHQDNKNDAMRNGKIARGERHGCAKLNVAKVRVIRMLHKRPRGNSRKIGHRGNTAILAARFGVSTDIIKRIVTGRLWRIEPLTAGG